MKESAKSWGGGWWWRLWVWRESPMKLSVSTYTTKRILRGARIRISVRSSNSWCRFDQLEQASNNYIDGLMMLSIIARPRCNKFCTTANRGYLVLRKFAKTNWRHGQLWAVCVLLIFILYCVYAFFHKRLLKDPAPLLLAQFSPSK